MRIAFYTTLYYGGAVDELFICNINDLEIPLGFELKADSFGLNVSHEIAEDIASKKMNKSLTKLNDTMTSMNTQSMNSTISEGGNATMMMKLQKNIESRQLTNLTFPNCKINKATS